jgi:quercetin dioxygenase-like cupin family protein
VRIGRADDLASRSITEFGSEGASFVQVARGDHTSVVQIELSGGGRLGMHPASCSQLFIVVEGEGVVLTDKVAPTAVSAGTIVWWKQGERHETRSETGLVAIVIEADSLALRPEE